jgi:hypothetical protein
VQQSRAVFSQLITGKEPDAIIGDPRDPFEQQIGTGLAAFPNDKRHDHAPKLGE